MRRNVFAGLWLFLMAVNVQAQPSIVRTPQDRTALINTWVSFAISAQSSSSLRYQWQFNGSDIPNARSKVLAVLATPSRAGVYSVRVTDSAGEASASAKLDVVRRPFFIVQPRNTVIGVHNTATFRTALNASGPYLRMIWHNYNPSEGSHEIPDTLGFAVDQPALSIPNCLQNDSYNGLYWLAVTNGAAGTVSRRAKLTVVGPPTFTNEPQDATAVIGGRVVLWVGIAPDAAPWKHCQWYKDGNVISGATQRYLVLRNVQLSDAGNYYCMVSSIGGSTPSWGAQVMVTP